MTSITMALIIIIALCNLVTLVTPGHTWSQWSLSRSRASTMITLMVNMALQTYWYFFQFGGGGNFSRLLPQNGDSLYSIYYQFILVTAGHTWSQLVTLVTVKVRNLNNDGLDVYYGPYGH